MRKAGTFFLPSGTDEERLRRSGINSRAGLIKKIAKEMVSSLDDGASEIKAWSSIKKEVAKVNKIQVVDHVCSSVWLAQSGGVERWILQEA
jgi:hypothetical protein